MEPKAEIQMLKSKILELTQENNQLRIELEYSRNGSTTESVKFETSSPTETREILRKRKNVSSPRKYFELVCNSSLS